MRAGKNRKKRRYEKYRRLKIIIIGFSINEILAGVENSTQVTDFSMTV